MKTLETAILWNAKEFFNNRALRLKDIMEWSSGEIKAHIGEVVAHIPDPGVYVAIKKENDKRVKT